MSATAMFEPSLLVQVDPVTREGAKAVVLGSGAVVGRLACHAVAAWRCGLTGRVPGRGADMGPPVTV